MPVQTHNDAAPEAGPLEDDAISRPLFPKLDYEPPKPLKYLPPFHL